jgi:hypothetical protein
MLHHVYAIETRPGFYVPRSKASETEHSPKLWVTEADVKRALNLLAQTRSFSTGFPRIVRFRLTAV